MKFSRYSSKVMAYVMALFQRQHFCLSNKTTTMCGCPARIVRLLPIRHDRIGEFTENKMRLAPTLMCRLTSCTGAGNAETPIVILIRICDNHNVLTNAAVVFCISFIGCSHLTHLPFGVCVQIHSDNDRTPSDQETAQKYHLA